MMITSLNMQLQAINCRCSPTRVTYISIVYKNHRHMHMNASLSLSLIIRLMLVGLPAWKRRTEMQNLPLKSVFPHQSNEVCSHHIVILNWSC